MTTDLPCSRDDFLNKAQDCRAAASDALHPETRAAHEEEAELWTLLARRREAVEAVINLYLEDLPAPEPEG